MSSRDKKIVKSRLKSSTKSRVELEKFLNRPKQKSLLKKAIKGPNPKNEFGKVVKTLSAKFEDMTIKNNKSFTKNIQESKSGLKN